MTYVTILSPRRVSRVVKAGVTDDRTRCRSGYEALRVVMVGRSGGHDTVRHPFPEIRVLQRDLIGDG